MGAEWSQDEASKPRDEQREVQKPNKNASKPHDEQREVQKPHKNDIASEIGILTTEVQLPHNHEEILKDADTSIDRSSNEKLCDQLQRGVFLNQKRKKYWVDRNMKNCFMLYASGLSITWGENGVHWHWPVIKESSDESIVAAELINVCWLEVHGRFNTVNLTARTLYEVYFVVMLKDPAYGWAVPVNLRLILADGTRKEHKENMMDKLRGRWIEIPAGEFTASPENMGEMEISLYEYEAGIWKRGLVIKGIIIRPKT